MASNNFRTAQLASLATKTGLSYGAFTNRAQAAQEAKDLGVPVQDNWSIVDIVQAMAVKRRVPINAEIADLTGPIFTANKSDPPFSPTSLQAPRKQLDFKNMARLSTIPSQGYTSSDAKGKIVIWLPHLPEEIELARENVYDQCGNNPIMPDGLWIYQYTNPLEIPLAFTLHAFDDLCEDGPQSLLDIGARLHAIMAPTNNQTLESTAKALSAGQSALRAASQNLTEANDGIKQPDPGGSQVADQKNTGIQYPPACSLRLIQAGSRGLGVNCVGFVKGVGVTLHGPYLQTADGADSFNLPSAATYKFTFVHNPTYTNTLRMGRVVQAFGPDIFAYFYNTAHLAAKAENTYSDVENLDRMRQA